MWTNHRDSFTYNWYQFCCCFKVLASDVVVLCIFFNYHTFSLPYLAWMCKFFSINRFHATGLFLCPHQIENIRLFTNCYNDVKYTSNEGLINSMWELPKPEKIIFQVMYFWLKYSYVLSVRKEFQVLCIFFIPYFLNFLSTCSWWNISSKIGNWEKILFIGKQSFCL